MVRDEAGAKLKQKKTTKRNKHIKNQIGMKTVVLICQDEKNFFNF